MSQNNTDIDNGISQSATNLLSQGSVFMLLTSLLVALIFHPLAGSLIYGPSDRFWIAAPTAVVFETLIIWKRLAGHLLQSLGWINKPTEISKRFTIRNEAYAIIAARMLNTRNGHVKRRALRLGKDEDVLEMVEDAYADIDEGRRSRLGVALPILAQYIKISVVSGPYTNFLRVLGTVYFVHWLTLELLISLSRKPNDHDLICRIQELLPLPRDEGRDIKNEGVFMMKAAHEIHDVAMFWTQLFVFWYAGVGFAILAPASDEGSTTEVSASFLWAITITAKTTLSPIPIALSHLVPRIWSCVNVWRLLKGLYNDIRNPETPYEPSRGKLALLPNTIGGEIGCIFFMLWTLYCIYIYDSTGTSRPDWPWLDWLG